MKSQSASSRFAIALLAVITAQQLNAASQTWSSTPVDTVWTNTSNWAGGAIPGVIYVTGNTVNNDIVTFNSALGGGTIGGVTDPIQIDLNRHIGGITFTGASVGAYVIGSTSGNELRVNHNQAIQVAADVVSAQTVNAPIAFRLPSSTNGIFTFRNNATSSSATLTFGSTVTSQAASTRPVTLNLEGSNTGANTITGAVNHGAGQQIHIVKSGTGTWVLSGANDLGANAIIGSAIYGSTTINAGTLSVRNSNALSTNTGTTTAFTPANINSTGTLELANNITLHNGVSLNLNNGGTITSNGSNAVDSRLNITTAAASSATISTLNASDVLTIGNGANDVTGGAADTVINISGPGTVALSQASNYVGNWAVNAGTLRATNATGSATGTGSLTVAASGTVAGTGFIGGATTVNGSLRANTAPVDNTSRLTFGSTLTLGGTGTTTFDIDGSNFTGVTLSTADTLTFGGSLAFNFVNSITPGTYDLFNFTDSNTGSFSSVSVTSIGALSASSGVWSGTYGASSYSFSELTGDLTVSAVPEPSTWAAIAGLAGLGFAASRRRRKAC
jgi:autotransporter-associated beta strand protein